jgi:hypothetical protein
MGPNPPTVIFLSRAARLVGGICVLVWVITGGMDLAANPNANASLSDLIATLEPTAILYLLPGAILLICGVAIKAGRLWPAPIIFLLSILSLFKLVLLLLPMRGPFFQTPLGCELPARILCTVLCVPCIYAWEDLAEQNRTRWRRRRYGRRGNLDSGFPTPTTWPAAKPPPPARRKRKQVQPEDPPTSQTPWS